MRLTFDQNYVTTRVAVVRFRCVREVLTSSGSLIHTHTYERVRGVYVYISDTCRGGRRRVAIQSHLRAPYAMREPIYIYI